jgi:molecular chaperone HscA
VEAQTEGRILADTTRTFVEKNKSYLSGDEIASTSTALQNLEEKIGRGTKDEVQGAIEALNEISKPYAERMMEIKVKEALVNKNIK